MATTIGTDAWIEKVTKAAMDNRANQLNPDHPAYWSGRNSKGEINPLLPIAAAFALGAAATAACVWAVKKFIESEEKEENVEETEEVVAEAETKEEE